MITVKIKELVKSIAIPLIVGGLSALISMPFMSGYNDMNKPPFAPPMIVFPIVWTILFILMGISAYLVKNSRADNTLKRNAMRVYALQLAVNFFWSIIFFNLSLYLLAFIWIILLEALVIWMIILFYRASPTAGLIQIPYALWLAFAAVLNWYIFILN